VIRKWVIVGEGKVRKETGTLNKVASTSILFSMGEFPPSFQGCGKIKNAKEKLLFFI